MDAKLTRLWLPLCLGVILLLSLLPFIQLIRSGAGVHGVVNSAYVDEYYTPLIQDVADGHLGVGNPWFFEHRDGVSPRQTFPYWISALPLLAGFPIVIALAINFSLWSLVFGVLLYLFFRRFGLPPVWSALGALYGYIEFYTMILRPVAMQLAYPAFLFFILAMLGWWERPRDRYRIALLGFATALTFYTYGYLYQISVVFLGLVFLNLLYRQDWTRVTHALMVGVLTILLCIPFILSTLTQVHNPNYVEAMVRTGLVFTHSPNILGVFETVGILMFIVTVLLSWRWMLQSREYPWSGDMKQFFLLGLALGIVSLSGVITGIDLGTANHVDRFYRVWLMLGTVLITYFLFAERSSIGQFSVVKKIATTIFIVFVFLLNIAIAPLLPLTVHFILKDERADIQADRDMLPALHWLDSQSTEPRVVWVDPLNYKLDNNIIIYTKDYQLSGIDGTSQLVSDNEIRERYLVASAASEVTEKRIADDIWIWGFGGYAVDTPNVRNREVHQCELLHLNVFGIACGQRTDASKLYAPLFASMYARYTQEIQPHLTEELKKFHVSYIVKDTLTDTQFHPELLENVKQVYSDGRFLIYKLI